MIGSSLCQVVAYGIQASAPPFPLFCLAGTINGFGGSIQDAQANVLVASLHENASEKMGLLHGTGYRWTAGVVIDKGGISLQLYTVRVPQRGQYGWRHAYLFIGLGALVSPLSATQFAQLPRWSFHFLVSLGVALLNTVFFVITVKGKSLEGVYCPAQQG